MHRHWKCIALIAPLTLAALALGGYAYSRAHAAPTYRLASGIEVTPSAAEPDDTAQLLEIKRWDFDVVQPNASKPLYIYLTLSQSGQPVKTLMGGFATGFPAGSVPANGNQRSHITLSLAPIGDTFFNARQLKYFLKAKGGSESGTLPNPVFKGHGLINDIQAVPADNAVLLLSTTHTKSYLSGVMADNDTNLALSFSSTPPH